MTTMTPQDAMRLADAELSLRSRLGYVALLLAAVAMTAVVASLWLTEPALPLRTRAAFGALTVIGLSWAGFALWVLTHRRVLLGRQGIVAGRMAVTFSTVFLAGALAIGVTGGRRAAFAAAGVGLVMVGAAVTALVLAHRRVDRLAARRRALEREIGEAVVDGAPRP